MPTTRNARPIPAAPRSTVSPSDVETLVAAAVLAPSMHNTQPWRFRLVDDALQLHVDAARTLRVTDPDGRALAISCGAALLGVRLAASVALGASR
jgi:nitroreductase